MILKHNGFIYEYDDVMNPQLPHLAIFKEGFFNCNPLKEILFGWNAIIKLGEVITAMNKQHDDAVKTVIDKLCNKPKVIAMIQTTPKINPFTHITIDHNSGNGIIAEGMMDGLTYQLKSSKVLNEPLIINPMKVTDDQLDCIRYDVEMIQNPLHGVEVEISITTDKEVYKKLEKNKNTDNVTFTEKDLLFLKYNFDKFPQPTKPPRFAIGIKINHYIYGEGEIIGVTFTNQGTAQYIVKFENQHPELRYDDDDFTTIEYFSEKEIERIINGKKQGNFGWALAMMRKGYKTSYGDECEMTFFIKNNKLYMLAENKETQVTVFHARIILRTDWKITGKVQ